MPVEIRELVIRARVEEQRGPETPATDSQERKLADVVSECVEQVLEILRREKER